MTKEAVDKQHVFLIKNASHFLSEVQMPGMDGLEATRQIRGKLGRSKLQLPIVGLTANYSTAEIGIYQEAGMNNCIAKPVRLQGLKRCLYDTMRQHE